MGGAAAAHSAAAKMHRGGAMLCPRKKRAADGSRARITLYCASIRRWGPQTMATLVDQLQQDALNPEIRVSDLLRRMKLTAAKLGLGDVGAWVNAELKGYDGETIPEYRRVVGQAKCRNPVRGDWMPLAGNTEIEEMISSRYIGQPLPGIEDTLRSISRGDRDGALYFPFAPHQVAMLQGFMQHKFPEMGLFISPASLVDIVDAVRDLALDWALDLERAGVSGSASNFTTEERQKASSVTIRIENFSGNLNSGDVSGAAARVNMASRDSSSNNVGADSTVFDGLEAALRGAVRDQREREQLLDLAADLRRSNGSHGFLAAYQKFIAAAADHMQLLAPFLPALSGLAAAH